MSQFYFIYYNLHTVYRCRNNLRFNAGLLMLLIMLFVTREPPPPTSSVTMPRPPRSFCSIEVRTSSNVIENWVAVPLWSLCRINCLNSPSFLFLNACRTWMAFFLVIPLFFFLVFFPWALFPWWLVVLLLEFGFCCPMRVFRRFVATKGALPLEGLLRRVPSSSLFVNIVAVLLCPRVVATLPATRSMTIDNSDMSRPWQTKRRMAAYRLVSNNLRWMSCLWGKNKRERKEFNKKKTFGQQTKENHNHRTVKKVLKIVVVVQHCPTVLQTQLSFDLFSVSYRLNRISPNDSVTCCSDTRVNNFQMRCSILDARGKEEAGNGFCWCPPVGWKFNNRKRKQCQRNSVCDWDQRT